MPYWRLSDRCRTRRTICSLTLTVHTLTGRDISLADLPWRGTSGTATTSSRPASRYFFPTCTTAHSQWVQGFPVMTNLFIQNQTQIKCNPSEIVKIVLINLAECGLKLLILQIEAAVGENKKGPTSEVLRLAMALSQHHDAISGTERQVMTLCFGFHRILSFKSIFLELICVVIICFEHSLNSV